MATFHQLYMCVPPADRWNSGKWGLKEFKWKGSYLVAIGLVMPVQEIFVHALTSLVGPRAKYFFSHRTLFESICPHRPASWALGRQSYWVACLLIMSLVPPLLCLFPFSMLYSISVHKLPERSFKQCLNSSTVLRKAELLFCTYSAIYFDTVETLIVEKPVLELLKTKKVFYSLSN